MIWLKIGLIAAVLGALGIQTFRLQGTQASYALYKQERESQDRERQTEAARQASFDAFNKRKTDEAYRAAVARAGTPGLRKPTAQIAAPAGSSDRICVGRGELNTELSGYAGREHIRFERLLEQSRKLLAAFNACKSWAVGLDGLQDGGGQIPPGAPERPQPTGTGVVAASDQLPR